MQKYVIVWFALALALTGCSSLLGVDFDKFQNPDGGVVSGDGSTQCQTCASLAACGIQNDGCGNTLDCGTQCPQNYTCNGQKCECTPKTCTELNAACGTVDDGCGHSLDCGACGTDSCVNNACKCVAKTCADYNNPACGTYPTGCASDTINCGAGCSGNTPNCDNGKCSATPCTPYKCGDSQIGNPCDAVPNGCGGTVGPCTTCSSPQTCGGGGTAHQCGCTAKTCAQAGNLVRRDLERVRRHVGPCVTCTSPQTCGGGGTAHQCGCTPTGTCPTGANCGTVPNGCGGNISCGPNCVSPDTCGGGGTANVCGCTSVLTSCSECCGTGTDNCGRTCTRSTCCGGGGGCFPESEPVLMGDGTERAMGTLHEGDVVMTYDWGTHALRPSPIAKIDRHEPQSLLLVNGRLHVTPNHPIYESSRGVIRADQLRIGDEIVNVTGSVARGEPVRTIVDIGVEGPVLTITPVNQQLFIVSGTVMVQKQ